MKLLGKMGKIAGRRLAAAILLHLAIVGGAGQACAMTSSRIDYNSNPVFEVYYYGAEDADNASAKAFFGQFAGANPLAYTLTDNIKTGLDAAFNQWAEILGPGARNKKPVQYFVGTNTVQNAGAIGFSKRNGEDTNNPNYLHAALQNGTEIQWIENIDALAENVPAQGYGGIYIGQNIGVNEEDGQYGFTAINTPIPVAQEMKGVDITAVMYHEIGHSLGISADIGASVTIGTITAFKFNDSANNPGSYAGHLYDQNGKRASSENLAIITPEDLEILKNDPPAVDVSDVDFFVVNKNDALSGRDGETALTFRGKNVSAVLDGKTFTGINGEQIDGIPINTWENDSPEFSHIELARSVMSHQHYRSYNSFIEAELAVMQDIGYKIDRKNFYGFSVYKDGQTIVNEQGFSARNADGTAYVDGYNTATYGVGLHIYGSNNHVTQKGNIWTKGAAAVGIRVDGLNNTVTVPKGTEVHGDGACGAGVLVAYGKNHIINIDGTVTGNGANGSGVWFEFGANALGATMEYRGSYIRYKRDINTNGAITKHYNLALDAVGHRLDDYSITDRVNGDTNEKMATLNVTGTISGKRAAIYIAEEAFVDNINLNEGARINGDIVSVWKHFDADAFGISDEETCTKDEETGFYEGGLMLQYKDQFIPYKKYIPDLVTNLNFNANMNYNGNISGADNMKLNVNRGTLNFGGTADVVNVNVAKGAALYGGSFTVNDMTGKMAYGFSDGTTGQFVSHGSIGASAADSNLAITGGLVSDGVLRAYGGGGKGWIDVSGSAEIGGSTASATNALPNETWTVLKAATLNGAISNPAGKPYAATGMLNTTGAVSGNTLTVTTTAANNLGATDATVNETYGAMLHMFDGLSGANDPRVNEMRPLFSLDAADAKEALSSISSNASAQNMGLAQTNAMTGHIVSSRLAEAFAQKPVNVKLPVANLTDGKDEKSIELPMKLPMPADNDFWFKVAKNWGDLKGGAYYHGTTFAGGWDRAYGKAWRAGAFVSYGTVGFADTGARNELKDTRLGFYGGYTHGPHEGYVYLDYGWLKNDLSRTIAGMGLFPQADYDSRILELGGEYKYDLHAMKDTPWHISPYINLQLSELWQDGYTERGAGIFGQRVNGATNTYFACGLGFEFKRYLAGGSYALRLGAKHAFSGADPKLTFGYVGDDASSYEMRNSQDATHFVISLSGEAEFAPGWWLAGDAGLQKGAHDKDMMCALTIRRMW